MASTPPLHSITVVTLAIFASIHAAAATADIILEDGYTVTTLIDGHKLGINPYSVHPRSGSSDLVVLDYDGSAFYTISFPPAAQESVVVRRLAGGKGKVGFKDGELDSALFAKPRNFALDYNGNVYVADKTNNAIRKISSTGVSTIAGGSSCARCFDGPAQNASFSNDFELVFAPERCALLISDHSHQTVRQINLKPKDCSRSSQSVLGVNSLWILGLGGLSCLLLGFVIGFAARPCINRYTGRFEPSPRQQDMEALPNQSGETSTDALLRRQKPCVVESQNRHEESVSLLDAAELHGCKQTKSQMLTDQLKDLIAPDGGAESFSRKENDREQDKNQEGESAFSKSDGKIDKMIHANIRGLIMQAGNADLMEGSLVGSSGLLKDKII